VINVYQGTPNVRTTSTYSVVEGDHTIIANFAGTITMTLPSASSYTGRKLQFLTYTNNTVVSASSNVVPITGGSAATAILAGTAGKWANLQSDGTSWRIVAAN